MVVYSKYAEQWGEDPRLEYDEETEDDFDEYDPDEDPRRKDWVIE